MNYSIIEEHWIPITLNNMDRHRTNSMERLRNFIRGMEDQITAVLLDIDDQERELSALIDNNSRTRRQAWTPRTSAQFAQNHTYGNKSTFQSPQEYSTPRDSQVREHSTGTESKISDLTLADMKTVDNYVQTPESVQVNFASENTGDAHKAKISTVSAAASMSPHLLNTNDGINIVDSVEYSHPKAFSDYSKPTTSRATPVSDDGIRRSRHPTNHEAPSSTSIHYKVHEQANCCSHNDSLSVLTTVLDGLAQRLTMREQLPTMLPEMFSGNILQYPSWQRTFEGVIEQNCTSLNQKLFYLSKCTSGEARHAIEGYLALNSEEGYQKARNLLRRRYGDKYLLARECTEKIINWPHIKTGDGKAMRELSDFLLQCLSIMESTQNLQCLDSEHEIDKILEKLPRYVVEKWSRIVDDWLNVKTGEQRYPSYQCFCNFLEKEARIACNSVTTRLIGRQTARSQLNKGQRNFRSFSTTTNEDGANITAMNTSLKEADRVSICYLCDQPHDLEECREFNHKTLQERRDFLMKRGLCFACLAGYHLARDCKNKRNCRKCNGPHPTTMHNDNYRRNNRSQANDRSDDVRVTSTLHTKMLDPNLRLSSMIVPVKLQHDTAPGKCITVYALLDEQSNSTFISRDTLNKLNVEGTPVQIRLGTMTGEDIISTQLIHGMSVSAFSPELPQISIKLPGAYVRDIPTDKSMIPSQESARMWPHLKRIANMIYDLKDEVEIGLLIGLDCPRALKPQEVIPGNDGDPWAVRTSIGWGIIGIVSSPNQLNNYPADQPRSLVFRTQVREISPMTVYGMFDRDFSDYNSSDEHRSVEDGIFLNKVSNGIKRTNDGHFIMPLPQKGNVTLKNNKELAIKRLSALQKRLNRDKHYRDDYKNFMDEMINNGYAEIVPNDELHLDDGRVWYLPHHGVYHPKKPRKIRIVFDCSAEFEGQSLNKTLLQGPNLTNNMAGVLCRFREERIAISCDIQSMFHQVYVDIEDRNLLRFLWWKDGNLDSNPVEYRMAVHLFGATSSPGCANYALKTTAEMASEIKNGNKAQEFIEKNFYVDDGLTSVPTRDEAIDLIYASHELCKKGGFNLCKYMCNDKQVLTCIPSELKAEAVKYVDVQKMSNLPIERTLGVEWCLESDTLQFRIKVSDKPLTRRGLLSTISSIFDPLGLLAPFVLKGKRILQELIRDGHAWDDPVPENIANSWNEWKCQLPELMNLSIPRCYKDRELGQIVKTEIHNFSDASFSGYGQCSYIRQIDTKGKVSTALLMAKARVPPSRPITVPRMELTAAVISVKVGNLLHKELSGQNIMQYFWTDSQVVIGYINNEAKRFHIFVANRVQQIHSYSKPEEWNYVNSRENPADLVSRGLNVSDIKKSDLWWHGPSFLQIDEELPVTHVDKMLHTEDPEVKKVIVQITHQTHVLPNLLERLVYFSSWTKAMSAVAGCLRFKEILKGKLKNRSEGITDMDYTTKVAPYQPYSVAELQQAEKVIIAALQGKSFSDEIKTLKDASGYPEDQRKCRERNNCLKKNSSLYRLDPFLDEDGILRIGGRIQRANLPRNEVHPVILPSNDHITNLIIDFYHRRTKHSGRESTLNEIRASGYWITKGRQRVVAYIDKCVTCKRLRASTSCQKMADLPEDRLAMAAPFSYSAVDYFGPFYIKEGRSEKKRWGVLFTCLSTRAVHVETANSLSTDAFLNAYRRFTCRRGTIRQLRSDCGTNFVGARSELEVALSQMNHDHIARKLLEDSCDWIHFKMNPPQASHMGGSWERMIRSIRITLMAILIQHGSRIDDEQLRTFLTEAEAIVNSRPITQVEADSLPLSPHQILTLKPKIVLPPPGIFLKEDLYCTKRWKAVQFLADVFWNKWRLQYLPMVQARQKWNQEKPNLKIGDIVLVKDDTAIRNQWPMARIDEVFPGSDGLVRHVRLTMKNSSFKRPIHKLVLLYSPGIPQQGAKDTEGKGE